MEVNRLLCDEVTYELEIRGLPTDKNLNQKRSMLSGALRCEKLGNLAPICCVELVTESEFEICNKKLTDLQHDIDNFNSENRINEFKRINSRLLHLLGRLKRIPIDANSASQRNELLGLCLQLVDELNVVFENQDNGQDNQVSLMDQPLQRNPHYSILDETDPLEPEILHKSIPADKGGSLIDIEEPGPSRSVRISPLPERYDASDGKKTLSGVVNFGRGPNLPNYLDGAVRHTSSPRKEICSTTSISHNCSGPGWDVSRLRIQYNGISSVTSFLERIEEIRCSRGISKETLLRAAPELFTGDALLWFRTNKFTSWDDLTEKLRSSFQPYDYEFELWDEIRRRTQGTHEKVINYVSVMQNLFNKLTNSPSEYTRVSIIRRNLLPYIQTPLALQHIDNVSQLIHFSRAIEETEYRTRSFCPPPTNYKQLIEPELAYHKPVSSHLNSQCNVMSDTETVLETSLDTLKIRDQRLRAEQSVLCWNCKNYGHRFRDCNQSRRVFCYRCGQDNVTVKTCAYCQKNGPRGQ